MTTPQGNTEKQPAADGYDEFANAFASLTENGDLPASDDAEKGEKPAEAAGTPSDSPAAAAPAGTEGAPASESSGSTPQAAAPDAAASAGAPSTEGGNPVEGAPAAPQTPETDWKAKYEELLARSQAPQEPQSAPQAPQAPAAQQPPAEKPLYTQDETAFLADYDKEWPDVVRGEALKRRNEYRILTQHIFSEFNRVYGPVLQRAAETSESFEDDSMLRAIQSAHPDYNDAMYDAVTAWAGGLKGFEKLLAEGIIREGTPEDVSALIAKYKEAKGIKPAAPAAPAATPAAPATPQHKATVTELPAAAKKAAQALGVVDSKRGTAAPTGVDPNDFDAAWNEAVNAK
jgi:hypothetical protein